MTVFAAIAFVLLAGGSVCFLNRLFRGPSIADRVIALDGLLVTVICGIMIEVTREQSITSLDTVVIVALAAFIGTSVLARYAERRSEEGDEN